MISVLIQGGTRPFTYRWTTGGSDSVISALAASNYGLTVTDANGCGLDSSFSILEPQAIIVSTSANDTICIGSSANISASATGGNGNFTFTWDKELGVGANKSVNPTETTVFIVSVTDSKACPAEPDSVTVYVRDLKSEPLKAQKQGDICLGDSTSVFATHNGTLGPYTYIWNTLGTGLGPFSVSPSKNRNYIINVTDRCGITISDTIQVQVNAYPLIDLPDTIGSGCEPLSVTFSDSLNQNSQGLSYNWDFGDGSTSSANPTTHTYTNAGTYQIILSITNQSGCESVSSSGGIISVKPTPSADFTANPQETDILNPKVTFSNTSRGENGLYWDFGLADKLDSINNEVIINFPDTGTYPIKLTVSNSFGCVDSIVKLIIINPVFEFKIPNAFSPNENGSNGGFYNPQGTNNDVFFVFADYVKQFHMMIFNRWGELIFESFDINVGWDGYYRNQLCQQDVYVYKVKITWIDGSKVVKAGDITLFR